MKVYWVGDGLVETGMNADKNAVSPHAKGKGEMKTHLLEIPSRSSPSVTSSSHPGASLGGSVQGNQPSANTSRLVLWNVEILARLLKELAVRRKALHIEQEEIDGSLDNLESGNMILDEVKEIITLPRFDKTVMKQLRDFVGVISSLYR
jgi:hypothetical protein